MSVESTLTKKIYQANGDTKEWPVPFAYSRAEDIHLMHTNADGIETPIISNFRVNVNEAGDTSVIYPISGMPLDTGKLTVYRDTPRTQIVDLIYGGAFSPDVLEKDGLDRLAMGLQEIQEGVDRSVKVSISSDTKPSTAEEFYSDISGILSQGKADVQALVDQAAALVDPVAIASGVYNVRRVWVTEADVPSGSTLHLPGDYFPLFISGLISTFSASLHRCSRL